MLTVKHALKNAAALLEREGIASARLDAELLLAHVLHTDRLQLYLNFDKPLSPNEESDYQTLTARRRRHEPVAYLCGEKEFMSLAFHVTPAVLIPRPETELLVERALAAIAEKRDRAPLEVFEVGAGCGAIAISLLRHAKTELRLTASDISPAALEVARNNARRHGLETAVQFVEADLFGAHRGPFDLIVSNPPYIDAAERPELAPDIVDHEPAIALFGGRDGLAVIERLIVESWERLRPGGDLIIELGVGQADKLQQQKDKDSRWEWREVAVDGQGVERVAWLRKTCTL